MVIFQMPDDRFYARSFAEEFSQLGPFIRAGVGRRFCWQQYLRFTDSLAPSIAPVIETKARTLPGEAFDLVQYIGQGAWVMAVVRETQGPHDYSAMQGARDGSFLPKLILFMLLTFRDATDLGFMKAVNLVFVFALLLEHSIKKVQLRTEIPESLGSEFASELAHQPSGYSPEFALGLEGLLGALWMRPVV